MNNIATNPTITISVDLANKILNYLGSKPFVEVAPLIQELQEQANSHEGKEDEKKK